MLLATLLFSRLALAFYACPASQLPAVAMAQMDGVDCTGLSSDHSKMIDEMQPALCGQHCANEQQASSAVTEPQASEPVWVLAFSPVPLLPLNALDPEWLRFAATETPPDSGGGGSLFLQTRRLRI